MGLIKVSQYKIPLQYFICWRTSVIACMHSSPHELAETANMHNSKPCQWKSCKLDPWRMQLFMNVPEARILNVYNLVPFSSAHKHV